MISSSFYLNDLFCPKARAGDTTALFLKLLIAWRASINWRLNLWSRAYAASGRAGHHCRLVIDNMPLGGNGGIPYHFQLNSDPV
jgi:hypothetical protein